MKKKFLQEKMDILIYERHILCEYAKRVDKHLANKAFRKRLNDEIKCQYEHKGKELILRQYK